MSQKQWRILDLLKVQASPKPSRSPSSTNIRPANNVAKCVCCGAALLIGENTKFHCSVCHTTTLMEDFDPDAQLPVPLLSYDDIKSRIEKCLYGGLKNNANQPDDSRKSHSEGNQIRDNKAHIQEPKHKESSRYEDTKHKESPRSEDPKQFAHSASTSKDVPAIPPTEILSSKAIVENIPPKPKVSRESSMSSPKSATSKVTNPTSKPPATGNTDKLCPISPKKGRSLSEGSPIPVMNDILLEKASADAQASHLPGSSGNVVGSNGIPPVSTNCDRPSASHALHQRLQPLLDHLLAAFGSIACLNLLFRIRRSRRAHYSLCDVNLEEVRRVFHLLALLPSKRPLFCALTGASNAIRRLPMSIADNPRNLYWVLVLLEIPFLRRALTNSDKRSHSRAHSRPQSQPQSAGEVPEIQALCYDILKRVLALLSAAEASPAGNYFASWFSKLDLADFAAKVDLMNLYITFHLRKHFYYANNPELARRNSDCRPDQAEYFLYSYLKDEVEEMHSLPWAGLSRRTDAKIRVHQYLGNYHLRTAAGALGVFVKANYIRDIKLPAHAFYNSMADYVNVRADFDLWLSRKKSQLRPATAEPALQAVLDYINGTDTMQQGSAYGFYLCQYPFLLTLGGKISILEYEARRQMERKAEEAFITSLDRRVALDVYFRVRIRREYIVQDLLRCIQLNPGNLKKSLKVQFVNEPGVDAGGLKKEWFLLLTRALFSPLAGMLGNVDDSNFLWFNVIPVENAEMYYLFGAVLGLAIYNLTILDLKFPVALYKLLLGMPLGLADYKDIFPVAAENLFKLRDFSPEDLEMLELTFEVTFHDAFGRLHHRELVPGGREIAVNSENREMYIDKYARFFLTDGMKRQLQLFTAGFRSVVDGNSFSLFLPEEIQLLLCGSEETRFDIDVLKSITHYTGWPSKEEALASPIVQWFWQYVTDLTFDQQKRLLLFITGSDRVPATGAQNLTLKISRLRSGEDSDRLPVAHTCFNELSIYQYSSREKMVDKLTKAVNMLAGFGIK